MRIIIADDQPSVRSALELLLHQDPNTFISEVINSEDLLEKVEMDCPDIILLDWELPGLVTKLITELHTCSTQLSVIVLSSRPEASQAALASGADAFICKGDPPEELLKTIDKCREKCRK